MLKRHSGLFLGLFLALCGLLALFPPSARAQGTGFVPPCVPGLSASNPLQAAGYDGSWLTIGHTDKHRWGYFTCTKGGVTTVVKFVGTRSHATPAALAYRGGAVEASATPLQTLQATWQRFVTLPLDDPRLAAGVAALNAHLARAR